MYEQSHSQTYRKMKTMDPDVQDVEQVNKNT